MADESRIRPGPLRWLWYAFGGGLPKRYRQWVLHDLTCRTWPWRHLARQLAQLAPFIVIVLVAIPGPISLRVMCAVGGAFVGLFYSFAYLYETTEHRAIKAGFPSGTTQRVRYERGADRRLHRAADDFERRWE